MTQKELNKQLSIAISTASQAFEEIFDKGGRPYILHCIWVMNKVRHLGTLYMIVAILHDLIEDTDWTYDMLREKGFSENIIFYISLLDFRNKDYIEQIKLLAPYKVCREIKMRDLEHNSKITRLKGVSHNDIERTLKYHKAYLYLKKYKNPGPKHIVLTK